MKNSLIQARADQAHYLKKYCNGIFIPIQVNKVEQSNQSGYFHMEIKWTYIEINRRIAINCCANFCGR